MITANGDVISAAEEHRRNADLDSLGLGLAEASPTGTKSQPTWPLMANSVGRAYCTGRAPVAIWLPISTPMTCAIGRARPEDRRQERQRDTGLIATSPNRLVASGASRLPIDLATPV